MRSSPSSSTRSVTRRALPVTLLAAGLLVAACSGSDSGASATSTPDTIEVSTLPSAAASDTTVPETTSGATDLPTTTIATAPVWPLTGLPLADPAAANHPAIVVKVGNYDAHPQRGSNAADIIYEEIINANVSRFAFVFHSQGADEVGPIRSGRRQDVDLFGAFNRPVFAWAGGNKTVTAEVENSDLYDLSQFRCQGTCYRTKDDTPSEFTLFFNVNKVFTLSLTNAGVPTQQFAYRAPDAAPAGTASAGVNLKMESYKVDWTWNPSSGLYERSQNGKADKDKGGDRLTTNNVVVLAMVYNPGISGSPDAVSTGSGEAWVFTAGNLVHGTWTRADRTQPFALKDDAGNPILLTPGRTFIELPRSGETPVPK